MRRIIVVSYRLLGHPIGPIFDCWILEDWIDSLSRNVGKKLPFYAAKNFKIGKIPNCIPSPFCVHYIVPPPRKEGEGEHKST